MNEDLKARLGGLVALALGAGCAWYFIWKPWQDAINGAPEVSYSLKAFVFAPMAAVFGLFFIVAGNRIPYRDVEAKQLTKAGWILMIVVAAISLGVFLWLKNEFAALGYR